MSNFLIGTGTLSCAPWNQREVSDLIYCHICGCLFEEALSEKIQHEFKDIDACPTCAKLPTCAHCGDKIQRNEKAVKVTEVDIDLDPVNKSEYIHIDCI